jgi:hypothetical protein
VLVHGADLCEAGAAVAASVSLLSRVYSQVVPVNSAVKDPEVTWQTKLLVNDCDRFICLANLHLVYVNGIQIRKKICKWKKVDLI